MSPETPFKPKSFVPLLERIRDLLLKHDYLAQATVVAELIDLAHLEDPSFADRLGGGELWGSAGSVADVVDFRRSLEPVDPDTERDSDDLIHALIRLADDMRARGLHRMDLNLLVTGSAAAWTLRGVADGRVVPETVVLLTFPWVGVRWSRRSKGSPSRSALKPYNVDMSGVPL